LCIYCVTGCEPIIFREEKRREEKRREEKINLGGVVRDTAFKGGKKDIFCPPNFEASQPVPAHLSIRSTLEQGKAAGSEKVQIDLIREGLCLKLLR
jgi:hypothetical protein